VISHEVSKSCGGCGNNVMNKVTKFHKTPSILMCALNRSEMKLSKKMKIAVGSSDKTYYIRGIIYFGGFHFTSRIVTHDGFVWFHDGIATGHHSQVDGRLSDISNSDLHTCHGKQATVVVYSLKQ